LGCLYRDWVATLYERYKERDPQQLVPHLENGVKNLERARSLLQEDGIVPEKHAFQYVDVTEDLARVYYWWARVEPEWQMKWWDKALKLLEKALEITNQHVPQPESGFLRGKIHHQLARIAREQKDGKAAEYYALAAGWLESYSLYLPELRKTVNDAADWLISLSSKEEAKQQIKVMQDTLDRNELMSSRLQEWVDDVVSPQVGVGWSELSRTGDRDQEVADG
jgi:tetratricopeptide (TPR) repeat protein